MLELNNSILKKFFLLLDKSYLRLICLCSLSLLQNDNTRDFENFDKVFSKEIDLLNGYYNDEQMIEKYSFNTVYDYDVPDGSNRTLLFMSPMFNSEAYDKAVVDAQRIWFIAIPFLLILILIETYFFNKKIKSR